MTRLVETLTWVAQQDPHDLARLFKHSRSDGCLVLIALAAESDHDLDQWFHDNDVDYSAVSYIEECAAKASIAAEAAELSRRYGVQFRIRGVITPRKELRRIYAYYKAEIARVSGAL